jgi:integrase
MPTPDAHRGENLPLDAAGGGGNGAGVKWTKVGENLVRHPAGTIYLRAKVGGKVIRTSLQTGDLRTAKRKRDIQLEDLRHAASLGDQNIETLGEALALEKELTLGKPKLKDKTRRYYRQLFARIEATLPVGTQVVTWTAEAARRWWAAHCKTYPSALHANNALAVVRRMMRIVVERGIRRDDPTKDIRRLRVPKTNIHDLPTLEEMDAIIQSIRDQKLRHSEETADVVEFLAWSGLRIGEFQALRWKDVGTDWLTVTGGGKGTKNMEVRQIPLNARLRAVLARRESLGGSMPVFHIGTPRMALQSACKRLDLRHLRVHDLRHWFTSHCVEKGIDVVTLAAWLGHKDGGKTLLATYAHHQKLHSLASAEKLGG